MRRNLKKRPTCAVASTRRELLQGIGQFEELGGPAISLYFGKYRISDLEPALKRLSNTDVLDGAVCVLDGPLGLNGPPRVHRYVDGACMRGDFSGRAVPASVCGGGRDLVEATYQIARAITGSERGTQYRFAARRDPSVSGPQVFETHPTVGLCILTAMLPVADIPSRRDQAKSDFYWEKHAGERIEAVLGVPGVAKISDHEHRAALYALAVAMQIAERAADGTQPVVIGKIKAADEAGVYLLLGPVHKSWDAAMHKVGIVT